MGSDAKKAFNAIGRDELLWFDPETLTIVEDQTSALADADRLVGPPPEWLVESIMADGIDVPVIVRLNGKRDDGTPIVEIVNGRQRVRSAREANRRIAAANKKLAPAERIELVRVPGVRTRGEDHAMLAKMIRTNVLFVEESPLSKARKAARYLGMGRSYAETALQFGVKEVTIKQWESLLECATEVQKAVEKGELAATTAAKLSELPREKQVEQLETMRANGAMRGAAGRAAADRATGRRQNGKPAAADAEPVAALPSRVWLRRLLAECEAHLKEDGGAGSELEDAELQGAVAVLRFALEGRKLKGAVGKAWRATRKEHDKPVDLNGAAGAE